MDSTQVAHANRLIGIHTERSIIRRELSRLPVSNIAIVIGFPNAAADQLECAQETMTEEDRFLPSTSLSSFLHNNLMAQLTTEIEDLERELTSMGVRLAFIPEASDARPNVLDAVNELLAGMQKGGSSADMKDLMRKISPQAAAYADEQEKLGYPNAERDAEKTKDILDGMLSGDAMTIKETIQRNLAANAKRMAKNAEDAKTDTHNYADKLPGYQPR
jgi:hypothetical protein